MLSVLIIFLAKAVISSCIWPPAYKINLTHEETFEIFEPLDPSDVQDIYDEEELIKKRDQEKYQVERHPEKLYRFHHNLPKENVHIVVANMSFKKNKVFETSNYDEYSPPWKAGFVKEDGNFIDIDDIIYFDEDSKSVDKEKRYKKSDTQEQNYDYSLLKKEYKEEIQSAIKSNDTLNYTDVKENENWKDSMKSLVVKTPRNCTEEEKKGIGIAAMECFLNDLQKPKIRNQVLDKIMRIVLIWFLVYLFIAIPCWCQYGWCCCCFRCKFCRPREEIEDVKKFFVNNPAGVFHDENGDLVQYQPTLYEKYAQKKLEHELKDL